MKLIKGNNLTSEQKRVVLSAYVYRLTTENGYPAKNPCRASVPAISDEQWLSEHAFYITKTGKLSAKHKHCEPSFMAEDKA